MKLSEPQLLSNNFTVVTLRYTPEFNKIVLNKIKEKLSTVVIFHCIDFKESSHQIKDLNVNVAFKIFPFFDTSVFIHY